MPRFEAELHARCMDYENAAAQLQKLESLPRWEDLTVAESMLKSAEIDLAQAKSQYDNVEGPQTNGALSKEEVNRRKFNFELAQAKVAADAGRPR